MAEDLVKVAIKLRHIVLRSLRGIQSNAIAKLVLLFHATRFLH